MNRYIDADKVLNDIECIDISDCTDIDDIFIEVEKTIDEQPTADVVEIVRCKECVYPKQNDIIKADIKRLKAFKAYFDELYGEGLEIANWHLNGELEPFDCFYESALQEMKRMDGDTE